MNLFSAPNADSFYPAGQFFGMQRNSASTGTAPANTGYDVGRQHIVITGVVLIAVAYIAWHYAMTH